MEENPKRSNVVQQLEENIILRQTGEDSGDPEEDIPEIIQEYLVGDSDCPGCEEAKAAFKDFFDSGQVIYVDVYEELGVDIMQAIGEDHPLPVVVYKLSNGEYRARVEEDV